MKLINGDKFRTSENDMILKWHINIYCYTMLIMLIFLFFLIIPEKVVLSKTPSDNFNKQMAKLANDNLKASNSKDRATVTRKHASLQKQKKMKSENVVINLIPFKFLLLVVMVIFVYLVFQNFWVRRPKVIGKRSR